MIRVVISIGTAAEWVVTVGAVVFIVQYTLYASWWRNYIGRSIVLADVCMLLIVLPNLISNIDPTALTPDQTIYIAVLALLIACYVVLSRILGWEKIRRKRNTRKDLPQ